MNDTPLRLAKDTRPDITGAAGSAWRHDIDAAVMRVNRKDPPPSDLTVASWLVHAPYAHPLWAYYWIGCVSLRSVPGLAPAVIHLPYATHEISVWALNPGTDPAIDDGPKVLLPANFHGQFIEACDEDAAARVQASVQEIVNGRLSPDTDFQRQWVQRYSDSHVRSPSSAMSGTGH